MGRSELKALPKLSSIEETVRFFEEHDMGDYDLPEVHFEVALKKRVPIERELYEKVDHLAHEKGRAAEELIEAWVKAGLASETAPR